MRHSLEFHRGEQNELIEKAYEKAVEIIKRDRIKTQEFADLYGADTISSDNAYVDKREEEFERSMSVAEKENLKLAIIFEAILHEHGEQSNWFGKAAVTIKTSRFDDIVNGVDEIVEFEEEKTSHSYLALAVDATYDSFPDHKLLKIKKEIENGELARIKYAVAEKTGFRGELNKVPRVVIGVSAKTIKALAEIWISKNGNKLLANHPVQIQILEEVLIQAQVFGKYAEDKGYSEITQKYKKTEAIIAGVIKEKKEQGIYNDERDDVFFSLQAALLNIIKR